MKKCWFAVGRRKEKEEREKERAIGAADLM